MARVFRIMDELEKDSEGFDERRGGRLNKKEDEQYLPEKAFKEGYEHGWRKAMKEAEGFNEKRGHEGFEEKIEMLKERYK